MVPKPLDGLSILVLEDEFLIAMDVEQLCLDSGASTVRISRSIEELGATPIEDGGFDAVVLDMNLGGTSTVEFGRTLMSAGKPFVFATGYAGHADFANQFPGVEVVGKPYNGSDLIAALSRAVERRA